MTIQPTPGWHPDPLGRYQHRYWEGTEWSGHVSTDGVTAWDPLEAAPVAETTEAQPKERKGAMLCKDLADTPLTGNYIVTARNAPDDGQKVNVNGVISLEVEQKLAGKRPKEDKRVEKKITVSFDADDAGIIQIKTLDGSPIGYLNASESAHLRERIEWVRARVSGDVTFQATMALSIGWAFPYQRMGERNGLPAFDALMSINEYSDTFSGTIAPA